MRIKTAKPCRWPQAGAAMCALLGLASVGCTSDTSSQPRPPQASTTATATATASKLTTLTPIRSPALPGSAEPHLASTPAGIPVMSWLEPVTDAHPPKTVALRYATLAGHGWSPARTLAQSDAWFVNWADFPSVQPVSEQLWGAHWLVKRPGGTYAYDIAVATSVDGGQHWSAPITPHTDNTATEHGFASLYPWHNGVGILWLDGRNMQGEGHGHDAHNTGSMTLRAAVLRQPTPSEPAPLMHEQQVDAQVCECCQTDVAVGAAGPIAVYRNVAERGQSSRAHQIRDIYISRTQDGQWQPGQVLAEDGWEMSGCPVNGPAIAALGAQVAVAWFTGADDQPQVRYASSQDNGRHFSAPVHVDTEQPLGRVDVVLLGNGDAAVSWLGMDGHWRVRRVSRDGVVGPARLFARSRTARASGFAQMIRYGDGLLFAWTDATQGVSQVRTAMLASAQDLP